MGSLFGSEKLKEWAVYGIAYAVLEEGRGQHKVYCFGISKDNGVLPSKSEQKLYNIAVIDLDGIGHSNMYKNGTSEQHGRMNQYVYDFIK